MEEKTGIAQAVDLFEGSPTKLANAIGAPILRQHVEHWLKVGQVPADKAPDVEAATGVPCELLNPSVKWSVVRGVPAPAVDANNEAD